VQEHVNQFLRHHSSTIDEDVLATRVGLCPELRHQTRADPNSTFHDQLFRGAARRNAGARQNSL
jgi:hypothetical protein